MDFTGVALGSGVNQYMKMDEMARQNKKLEMDKALADQQLSRGQMELDELRAVDDLRKRYSTINQAYARGEYDNPEIQGFFKNYNAQNGAWNDGYTMGYGSDAKGNRVLNFMDADGKVVGSESLDPKNFQRLTRDAYMRDLQFISPRYGFEGAKLDLERGKNDILQAHYGRPTYLQDGTGRIIGLDSQGRQIGTYGAARPQLGGTGAQTGQLLGATADRSGLIYNVNGQIVKRPLPEGVTADDLFPKATGVRGNGDNGDMKHVGGNVYSQNGQSFVIDETGAARPVAVPGDVKAATGSLAMSDPRKPAQGTGLKTPQAVAPKVSAEQQAKDFAQKYRGWSRQKAGNDFIVVGPNGQRMWAADFDEQNGPNSSLMLNYK